MVSWVAAATWQGPRYSTAAHSISDMYAETAPHAAFLIVVFTLCGAATIAFAFGAVRRALRPGGWTATVGSALLALFFAAFADAIGSHYGLGGLFERLIALIGAARLASLAVAILRRTPGLRSARRMPGAEPVGATRRGPG